MLRIEIKEGESIERALKRYKRKYRNVKLLQEIREREQYTKPSERRREIKKKAEHREKYLRDQEI